MKLKSTVIGVITALAPLGLIWGQNVGIGTSKPLSKLHVSSQTVADGLLIDNTAPNGDPILQFGLDGMPVFSLGIDDSDGDKLKLGTSSITSNTRLTVQNNGYIGIGTSSPMYNLHVTGSRSQEYIAYFQNTHEQGSSVVGYTGGIYAAVGAITENSNGLGLYGAHLPVAGTGWGVWGTSNSSDAIGIRGTVPTTGAHLGYGGYFAGSVGYMNGLYNLSDARVKQNIVTIDGALDKVARLRGVTYQYNTEAYGKYVGDDRRTYTGFLAQEVEQVVPEAVAEKYIVSDGTGVKGSFADMQPVQRETVKVVDYVSLVPVLVEAIKELQSQVESLQQKVEELEAR